jgi:adenylate cyclase
VLAAVLVASLLVSGRLAAAAGDEEIWARLRLGALAIGALLALGILSLALVRTGAYAPWMAPVLTAADALIVVVTVAATLHDNQLGANWIAIAPALWATPLILAVGALRYGPGAQLWATGVVIAGLVLVVITFPGGIFLPPGDAAGFAAAPVAADLLSLPANLVRAVMLALAGATTALVMLRARRLLHRTVTEASERASIARFLPAEIAPLMEGDSLEVWRQGRRQEITVMFVDLRGSTA